MNRPLAWTALLLVGLPAVAGADTEQAASAELGWATFSTPGQKKGSMQPPSISPDVGGSLGLVYERALSTDFSLRGEMVGAVFTGGNTSKQSATSYAGLADVGAVFRFDVLKYVPYAFGGIGALVSGGGPIERGGELVLSVGGGLDVLASRSRSWGIEARVASFGGDVTVVTVGVRGTMRWGYF